MKSLSPALQAHLDEGTTTLAWCWRIARADGVTFGFTDHDRTLAFDGTDFEPESGLTASEVRSGSDLSLGLTGFVLGPLVLGGSDLLKALREGRSVSRGRALIEIPTVEARCCRRLCRGRTVAKDLVYSLGDMYGPQLEGGGIALADWIANDGPPTGRWGRNAQ